MSREIGSCVDALFEAHKLARPYERSMHDVGDGTALGSSVS